MGTIHTHDFRNPENEPGLAVEQELRQHLSAWHAVPALGGSHAELTAEHEDLHDRKPGRPFTPEEAGELLGTVPQRQDPPPLYAGGQVTVSRMDLDYLLAHFYDEVLGSPDRSHWQLPLLRQAADRLAAATRPPGAEVHPVVVREPRA